MERQRGVQCRVPQCQRGTCSAHASHSCPTGTRTGAAGVPGSSLQLCSQRIAPELKPWTLQCEERLCGKQQLPGQPSLVNRFNNKEKVSLSTRAFHSFLFSRSNPQKSQLSFFQLQYFSASSKCFDREALLIHDVGALDELPHTRSYFCTGRTCEGKFLVPRSTRNQDRGAPWAAELPEPKRLWRLKAWRWWAGASPGALAFFLGSPGDKQNRAGIPPSVCVPCLTPAPGLFTLPSLCGARLCRFRILIIAERKFFKQSQLQ